jgi:ribosome-associated protein
MPTQTIVFQLKTPHVELCHLLKLVGLASSGGQGKALVAAGEVLVDGQLETRKTAKIRAGQVVECQAMRIEVVGP